MWACPRMTQKRADLIRGFGRKDVFELARLLLDLGLAILSQAVGKQPLRLPVSANDVGGALARTWCELYDYAAVADRKRSCFHAVMAWFHNRLVVVCLMSIWRS